MSGVELRAVGINPYTKATKRQILEYIRRDMFVETWQVEAYFNYSPLAAKVRLYGLRRQGLLENKVASKTWNLTEKGYKRLEYYERKEKDQNSTENKVNFPARR